MKWCLNPFRKIGELEKEIKNLEKELRESTMDYDDTIIKFKVEIESLNKQLADGREKSARDISKKDEEIERLNRELDVLYKYYDLDQEASEYIKRQIRIDKTVFELQMENMELRKALNNGVFRTVDELKRERYWLMAQNCMQQPMWTYSWRGI